MGRSAYVDARLEQIKYLRKMPRRCSRCGVKSFNFSPSAAYCRPCWAYYNTERRANIADEEARLTDPAWLTPEVRAIAGALRRWPRVSAS